MNCEQFVWASVPTLNIDRPKIFLGNYFYPTYHYYYKSPVRHSALY
ncbi:hypothetical protein [Microcoleus sp. F4-D5]